MLLSGSPDYGPFAPVVGYASAIMATGTALFVMWGGRMKKWRPPDTDMPGTTRAFVLLLCGVFMVVEFYFAEPVLAGWMIGAVVLFAILSLIFYLRYASIIGDFGYLKPIPKKGNPASFAEVLILGGRVMRPDAEEERKQLKIDTQTLLAGKQYWVELIWDRPSLGWVRTRALLYFILMLVLGTSALTAAGFATQVILTKRAAASVIHKNEAPGLGDNKSGAK